MTRLLTILAALGFLANLATLTTHAIHKARITAEQAAVRAMY